MEDYTKYFDYIQSLNHGLNMSQLSEYVEEEFDISTKEARNIVLFWFEHRDDILKGRYK